MTAFFPFTPQQTSPFQFQPVLDGSVYRAAVPSLLFGNRYYLDLRAVDGTPLSYRAVVGSKPALQLQALSWANGRARAQTALPHGYKPASSVSLTVAGCTPVGYNGLVQAMSTGPATLQWSLAADPGAATVLGQISQDVNLIGGVPNELGVYFTSTIVFRTGTQQFEVSP
jgi:hypothetical protein